MSKTIITFAALIEFSAFGAAYCFGGLNHYVGPSFGELRLNVKPCGLN